MRPNKFKHFNCGDDIETSCHYLLYCSLNTNEKVALLNVTRGNDNSIVELGDYHIVKVLLYGKKFLYITSNSLFEMKSLTSNFLKVKFNGLWLLKFLFVKFNFFL